MFAVLLPLTALFLAVAVLVLGHGLLFGLLPLSMTEAGFPAKIPGYLAAAYFAGLVGGTLIGPALIRAVGHIRAFAGFAAIAAAMTLLFAMWKEPWFWIAIRLIYGICAAGLMMSIESWLNVSAPQFVRGRVLALYMIVFYGAMGSGQFFLNLFPVQGFELFSLAAILLSIGLVPVALSQVRAPVLEDHPALSVRRLISISPLGLFASFAAGLGQGAVIGLLPVYAFEAGGASLVPLAMATVIYGGLLLQWPIGWLSDIFDRRTVIIAGAAITAVAALVTPLADHVMEGLITVLGGHLPLLAGLLLFGGLLFSLYSLSLAHAADFLPEGEDMVSLSSGLLMANSIGAVIGPLIAAQVFGLMDGRGLFVFCAVVTGAITMFGFYRTTQRAAMPLEDQGHYIPVPRTTAFAYDLDPRADDDQMTFDFASAEEEVQGEAPEAVPPIIDVEYEPVDGERTG